MSCENSLCILDNSYSPDMNFSNSLFQSVAFPSKILFIYLFAEEREGERRWPRAEGEDEGKNLK